MDARRAQMFPLLEAQDFARLKRFGEPRQFPSGTRIVEAGQLSPGLLFILAGKIGVSQGGAFADHAAIVEHGPGNFMGSWRAFRPAGAYRRRGTERRGSDVVPSRALRDLLVQEAELGESLMRALILRRVGLLEAGQSGPIIVGRRAMAMFCGWRIFSPATAILTAFSFHK